MYAHSIKNPHIIHFRIKKRARWLSRHTGYEYLCCNCYTPSKATTDPTKVTCKNCLKLIDAGKHLAKN